MAKVKISPIQIQKYLKGIEYPATREELIEHAKRNKADVNVISILEEMKVKKFNSPADVSKGLKDSE